MPRLTPAVKFIIMLTTGVYILELIAPATVIPLLALVPRDVLHGRVWELFTYMLVHSMSPFHVLMNMLTLYFFGGEVESAWGTKRFAWFYVICGVGAGLCALLFDPRSSVVGASGAVFGVMVAFAMLFPDAVIYFFGMIPMRAPHLVLLFMAIEMAMLMQPGSGGGVSSWAHLGGAGVGYLYVKFSWRIGNWWKQTFSRVSRGGSGPIIPLPRRSARTPARTPKGSTPPGGATVSPLPTPRTASATAASAEELAIQRRADQILDKISREGMQSLSREERELLARHSQILKAREGGGVSRLDDYRS